MRVIVTLHNRKVETILPQLEEQGLTVDAVLDAIGVITGEVVEDKIPVIAAMEGVTIEPEQEVQIPPPDAPIQ